MGELARCLQLYFQAVPKTARTPQIHARKQNMGGFPISPIPSLTTASLHPCKFYEQLRVQSPRPESWRYPAATPYSVSTHHVQDPRTQEGETGEHPLQDNLVREQAAASATRTRTLLAQSLPFLSEERLCRPVMDRRGSSRKEPAHLQSFL